MESAETCAQVLPSPSGETALCIWKLDALPEGSDYVAFKDAEDYGSIYGRGGILCSFDSGKRGPVSPQVPRADGIHPNVSDVYV
jgi:hypothetical protein